jgi:hypothetical protein
MNTKIFNKISETMKINVVQVPHPTLRMNAMNRQIFIAAAIITVVFGMVGSGIGTEILFANA